MNIPFVAKATFEALRNQPVFLNITQFILARLQSMHSSFERAKFIHDVIEQYNEEVFAHPLVKEFMPCKAGCSACCHTQVSVTRDEAELLLERIHNGLKIDHDRLQKQAAAGDDDQLYFQLSFDERKCVFLSGEGECRVYEDRPSVCRTNAVLGPASQCDTRSEQGSLRLVKTSKSDMVIVGAFAAAEESGTLPHMLSKLFKKKRRTFLKVSKENLLG